MVGGQASTAERIGSGDKQCFCPSAKIAVALAATAMPFASTHCEEAERWLRILRVNGVVGNAMQALGMPEDPFEPCAPAEAEDPRHPGTVEAVIAAAAEELRGRGGEAITTEDLFVGVRRVYGPAFEHALDARGTTSGEVLELIARREANAAAAMR
jgi:hypothetical protein